MELWEFGCHWPLETADILSISGQGEQKHVKCLSPRSLKSCCTFSSVLCLSFIQQIRVCMLQAYNECWTPSSQQEPERKSHVLDAVRMHCSAFVSVSVVLYNWTEYGTCDHKDTSEPALTISRLNFVKCIPAALTSISRGVLNASSKDVASRLLLI